MTEGEPQQRPATISWRPPTTGANAGMPAPARESITADPQQQPQPEPQRRRVTPGDLTAIGRRFGQWVTPPNPKSTPPPTWEQLKLRGDVGRHAPREGWPRTVSVVWSRSVGLPGRALAVWLDWISRSPSRFLAALILCALITQLPGMSWLPWIF